MGVFSSITAKATSLAAGYYMLQKAMKVLPERIEAFQEGNYLEAFFGDKFAGLSGEETEKETGTFSSENTASLNSSQPVADDTRYSNILPEDERYVSTDVPELPDVLKQGLGYDGVVSSAHEQYDALMNAALTSDEAMISTSRDLFAEAYADSYMKMIMDPNFKQSGFYNYMQDTLTTEESQAWGNLVAQHDAVMSGQLSPDALRQSLMDSVPQSKMVNLYSQDEGWWSIQHSYSYYQSLRVSNDSFFHNLFDHPRYTSYDPSYQSDKLVAFDLARTSFCTGYDIEDAFVVKALESDAIRSKFVECCDDPVVAQQVASCDYSSPMYARMVLPFGPASVYAMGRLYREDPDKLEEARSTYSVLDVYDNIVPYNTVNYNSHESAFEKCIDYEKKTGQKLFDQSKSVDEPMTSRSPALQAETDAISAIGYQHNLANSMNFGL